MRRSNLISGTLVRLQKPMTHDRSDSFSLVGLYFLTAVCLIAAEGWLSQQPHMVVAALKVLGVLGMVCAGAGMISRRTGSTEVGVLAAVGYLYVALKLGTVWAIVPLAVVTLLALRRFQLRPALRFILNPLHWAAALATTGLIISITAAADFLIVEKTWQGAAHQDALFNASVAAMIKTYGIASTGVNGLAPLGYHILSHQLLDALSILAKVPVLEMYGMAQIVLLSPLLVWAVSWAAMRVVPSLSQVQPGTVWLLTCAVLLSMEWLPMSLGGAWNSYFNSESYTLGLVLFLLALPGIATRESSRSRDALTVALIVLAGLAKISVGVIGLGLLAVRIILLPGKTGRAWPLGMIALAGSFLAIVMRTTVSGGSDYIIFDPLYLARSYATYGDTLGAVVTTIRSGSRPALRPTGTASLALLLYLVANFLVSLIVILRRIWHSGLSGLWRHADALLSLAAFAVGLVVLQFRWSGSWYFLNQAMFVSMPFLVAALAGAASRLRMRWPFALVSIVSLAAAAGLVLQGYQNQPLGSVFVKSHRYVDRLLNRGGNGHIGALMQVRERLRSEPVILKRDAAFPAPTEGIWDCFQVPFTYPAVTEHAWVGVVDTKSACKYQFYGYQTYFAPGSTVLLDPVIPLGATIVDATTFLHGSR